MIDETLIPGSRSISCRTRLDTVAQEMAPSPIIVAIHGGTFTSSYFDILGCSLLERAAALIVPIIAIDRPGHGQTGVMAPEDLGQTANARSCAR